MTIKNEKDILDFLSELLALDQLKDILEKVVSRAPTIIYCEGCSIYLIPELVKQYNGEVIDHNNNRLSPHEINKPFIVLSAHSHANDPRYKIGSYFYRSGEGLTGWVFKEEKPLILDNLSDPEQLEMYEGLEWKNKYDNAKFWFSKANKTHQKPFIALPLVSRRRCVGVIRFVGTKDGKAFTKLAKATVISFCDLIAKRIETELSIRDKQRSIENLISVGTMDNKPDVFKIIVEESRKAVGGSACLLYQLDEFGEKVKLIEAVGDLEIDTLKQQFERSEGYIGWIFKYCTPLLKNNITPVMSVDVFNVFTRTGKVDFFESFGNRTKSFTISLADGELGRNDTAHTRFIGVPLSKGKGRMHGVLVVLSHSEAKPFNEEDLYILKKFGQTVSLLMENLRQQKLNNMLIEMGHKQRDDLFQYTVDHMPPLVVARGCSIFQKSNADDVFKLTYTSSPWLKNDNGKVLNIKYKPWEGKTGYVIGCGRILVINHYGMGDTDDTVLDQKRLNTDFRYYTNHPDVKNLNIVAKLVNNQGTPQGLARLVRDKEDPPFTLQERESFYGFVKQNPYFSDEGLECHEHNKICEEGTDGGFSTSFIGVPLRDRYSKVHGVMRIPKSAPGGSFTDEDVKLVVSICNRLFSYIELEQNLITLTKINNQINANLGAGDLNSVLEDILSAVIDTLSFEFVLFQLVSPDKKSIKNVLSRYNKDIPNALDPKKWSNDVNFSMVAKNPDIHAWLLRKYKKPKIIKGWHKFFNKEIYNTHNHKHLIRAFIPIILQNTDEIIGTIEAGHHISRKDSIGEEELNMLKALADCAAIAIKNKQLHEELKSKIKQLQRTYKELANVSHELKAPLTYIKRHFDNILSGVYGTLTEDQRRLNITLFRNAQEEIRLIDNILDLALIQEDRVRLDPKDVDLKETIRSVLQLLELDAVEKNIKIETSLDLNTPKVRGDKEKIRRIIVNLVHNAIKYSPEGGRVVISDSIQHEKITISIADEGPGIAPDQQKRIFQRHYRIDKKMPGIGLGLEISMELAKMHNGTISVRSKLGEGSQFLFSLPIQ